MLLQKTTYLETIYRAAPTRQRVADILVCHAAQRSVGGALRRDSVQCPSDG